MDLLSSSSALIYGDITQVNFSTIQNVLFVNTAAQSLIQYVKTDDTFAILYDNTSTTDEVMQCFRAWFPAGGSSSELSLNRIGFAFHYSGTTGQDSVIPFMNQQPLFTDSDLGDSSVATFSPNTQFMLDLLLEFRTVTHLDFLACGTLLNEKCKQYYNLLQSKTDVVIGASDDNTGNIRYGGDWVMESTHEDIECIYFTTGITNWASLLATTGTVTDNKVSYVWSSVTGNAVCSSNASYSDASYTILSSVTDNGVIYPVTDISASAFYNCDPLTSITIPPSVVQISGSSFKNINVGSKLATVTFSDISLSNLRYIYAGAFHSTKLTYIWLPYNLFFIGTNVFANVTTATVIVLPSATGQQVTFGTSTIFNTTLSTTFYVYTSSDLGATFNYNKFIGTPVVTSDGILRSAYSDFSSNKLTATIWQPIKSMAILSGTRYVNGSYYVYQNASFDVSFTKIIPGTTYTSTGSLSTTSTNTMLTSDTTQVTFLSSSSTAGPIVLSMSDNSPPLTINNVSRITQSNIKDATSLWSSDTSSAITNYGMISDWDVSVVTDMSGVFYNASTFNDDISKWNVSNVTNMSYMFNGASSFSGDISGWTVSQVTNMSNMFNGAAAFNANISSWNVGNVRNMIGMFDHAVAFNQNLSKWNVQNIPSSPLEFLVAQTIPLLTGKLPLWGTNGSYLNNFHHTFYTMSAASPTILTRTIYDNVGNLMEIQDISFGGMTIASVLSLLDGGAGTNPYTIGMVDASDNRICMDLAYCNVYTQELTSATQKTLLMNDVNTRYKEPHTAATTVTYIVTVSGDAFWLSSNGGVSTTITPLTLLFLGNLYVFDQSHSSNANKRLTINYDVSNTVRYTPGVSMNGTPGSLNAYTLIDLSNSGIAVDTTLYYGVNGSTGGILHIPTNQITTYTVTVSDGVFWLNNLRQLPTMISGYAYLFVQSDSTNSGNTLVLGASLDSSSYYSNGVITNGTAGSLGAYTYLSYSGQYQTLSCYSSSHTGMGLTSLPSSATISSSFVLSGSSFTTNLISMLVPGSVVHYSFTGCTSADFNGASLTELSFIAPYGTRTDTFTMAGYALAPTVSQETMTISVVPIPVTTYAVTVSGDNLFYINGSRQSQTMVSGNVYLFDQSSSTNIGNTLVLGVTLDSLPYYTTGVVTNGTAGSEGAYTLINYTSTTLGGLRYFSRQTTGMGINFTGTSSYSENTAGGYKVLTLTGSGSLTINTNSVTTIYNYYVIGGGGAGGTGKAMTAGTGGNGGNGGVVQTGSFNNNGSSYSVVVGSGGSFSAVTGSGSDGGSSSLTDSTGAAVTANGGYKGKNGIGGTTNTAQDNQTNAAKGGTGVGTGTGTGTSNGGNGISFFPTPSIMYGGAGGGGTRLEIPGSGGATGGGNGNGQTGNFRGYPGANYGSGGGGGAGSGGGNYGSGGSGYQGAVFLYWLI